MKAINHAIALATVSLLIPMFAAAANPLCPSLDTIRDSANKLQNVDVESPSFFTVYTDKGAIQENGVNWTLYVPSVHASVSTVTSNGMESLQLAKINIQFAIDRQNTEYSYYDGDKYVCYYHGDIASIKAVSYI